MSLLSLLVYEVESKSRCLFITLFVSIKCPDDSNVCDMVKAQNDYEREYIREILFGIERVNIF